MIYNKKTRLTGKRAILRKVGANSKRGKANVRWINLIKEPMTPGFSRLDH